MASATGLFVVGGITYVPSPFGVHSEFSPDKTTVAFIVVAPVLRIIIVVLKLVVSGCHCQMLVWSLLAVICVVPSLL